MKRAIRENLATGGVPFTIPRSEPRRNHPRVVLVVDVSWSAARAAGLFLMLALELLRHDRRTRVHLFVDRPVDATEALRSWLRRSGAGPRREEAGADARMADGAGGAGGSVAPSRTLPRARRPAVGAGLASPAGEVSFAAMLDSVRGIDPGAASDYGRTFYALGSGPLRTLGKDAVLVVLGDGRTNVYEPLPWAFEEIAERARRVIWLIPEARERWGTGDSALPQYLQFCDVAVEARDLEGLARGVRELARAL